MTGLNLLDKTYVFNATITAPSDAVPGSNIQGKIVFDTTIQNVHLQAATLKLECLEYHISPPSTPEYASTPPVATPFQVAAPMPEKGHHKHFLDFFHKYGKAPKKIATSASTVNSTAVDSGVLVTHEEHYANEIKFEHTISLIPATESNSIIKPGRHEYEFTIQLPQNFPLTSAVDKSAIDVILVVSRLHAVIQIENVKEDVYHVIHVLNN
ncbi:UNVERIFIED_CONTAM: hypothetical protein HDU68_002361 [Siphonaria sp. JEL0065]|nr:hypothetical protein HDU68_002361 [Siphonaria sp. JEL0065]